VVNHLQRPLLHVPEYRHVLRVPIAGERQAHLRRLVGVQNPDGIDVHLGAAGEEEPDLGHREILKLAEVVAGVEDRQRRAQRVLRHLLPERRPEGGVRRRREAGDGGAGVDDGAGGGEHGG
ncbi:unnamed protein product, partial [Linum tenue]